MKVRLYKLENSSWFVVYSPENDLFKNEDGSFSDEWVLDEDSDEIPLKEEDDEPFIKSLIHEIDKKDKKIKKMRMSELRAIIRSEIKKILDEK